MTEQIETLESQKNYKVLIVDDIPVNLQLLSSILYKEGLDISAATNGRQALESAACNLPDIILLDVSMPKMDGYEVCRELKKNPATALIPVIFLTAKVDSEDILKGFESGAVDYVTKPFNPKELMSRVSTHLELKRSRDYIALQNRELSELNSMKDKLFSIIAHDLRNPVGSILGFSEILDQTYEKLSEDERRQYIKIIRTSGKNMYALLTDLLEWARSQLGRIETQFENIHLKALADKTIDLSLIKMKEKNITIINGITESCTAYANETMIRGVLRNLISNALKFTASGGKINLISKEENGLVRIEISDTGIGISPENLTKLFRLDQNITTPGTSDETGTGLGLILCKDFIEKNNGRISVESEIGKGTTFKFTLPGAMK